MERKTGKSSFVVIVPDPSFLKKEGKRKSFEIEWKSTIFRLD